MGAAFQRQKSIIRGPSGCLAFANAQPCWAEPCASMANRERAQRLPSVSPGRRRRGRNSIRMKILIIDDHAVVREGLKLILRDHFKNAIFGEARNATEALECVWKEKWDVVVLDITMPGRSGLEVLKE